MSTTRRSRSSASWSRSPGRTSAGTSPGCTSWPAAAARPTRSGPRWSRSIRATRRSRSWPATRTPRPASRTIAAERFVRALELALHSGADGETLRQIVGARTEALAAAGLEPGPVDEAARLALARAAAQGADTPVATPFFAPEEFALALDAWPGFARGLARRRPRRLRAGARSPDARRRAERAAPSRRRPAHRGARARAGRRGRDRRGRRRGTGARGLRGRPGGRRRRVAAGAQRAMLVWIGKKYKKCCGVRVRDRNVRVLSSGARIGQPRPAPAQRSTAA